MSPKSVSPSPLIGADRREGSKNSSNHSGIDPGSPDDVTRYPTQFAKQYQHGGSTTSLGVIYLD